MTNTDELVTKLDNMTKMGYRVMTVSDLVQKLAGLPPMMEVYVDADGAPMFLNGVQIELTDNDPPFLRIVCNPHPVDVPVIGTTHEENEARQRQRAMDMSAQIERETRMHPMVD